MDWFFWNKKNTHPKHGFVGIHETANGISMAYCLPNAKTPSTIKAYRYDEVGSLPERQASLRHFVLDYGLNEVPCCYVLQNQDYLLNLIDTPKVSKEEVNKALQWLARDLITYPIEEAVIDSFELPIPRARDNAKISYVIAMRRSLISTIETLVTDSGLELKYIDIPELALNNILKLDKEAEKGVIFINLVPNEEKMIISKEGNVLFARNMDINFDTNQAEELQNNVEQLIVEIQRSMDYANGMFRQTLVRGVLLSSLGIDKALLQKNLQEALGLQVVDLNVTTLLDFDIPPDETEQGHCLLAMGGSLKAGMI